MKKIKVKNYDEISELLKCIMVAEMASDRRVNVVLTAGNSPRKAYSLVADEMNKDCKAYENAHFYNFDNFYDQNYPVDKGYTCNDLQQYFYGLTTIKEENIHDLTMKTKDDIEESLYQSGGIDLCIMGLGFDGHIAGFTPLTTKFLESMYIIKVADCGPDYIDDMENKFPGIKEYATFGPKLLMSSKKIVLVVNGKHKAQIFKKFFDSEITPSFPASIFKIHPNFIVIYDDEAAELLDE